MIAFKDMKTAREIKDYLLNVLARTGNKKKGDINLYHYTSCDSVVSMISSGYLWLGSTKKMNDYLEGEIIDSIEQGNNVFFSCFSRAEENIAMYKMYAPMPNGVMMSVPYPVAQKIIDNLPDAEGGNKLVRIVRNKELTEETIEANVYWAAVAYKDLHTNLIKAETVVNNHIKNPLNEKELAGYIKLYGWEYEKEVRLVAITPYPLKDDEKVAIKLPEEFAKKVQIKTCPAFDKKGQSKALAKLKLLDISRQESEYDGLVDLGRSFEIELGEKITSIQRENENLKQEIKRLSLKSNSITVNRKPQLTISLVPTMATDNEKHLEYYYNTELMKVDNEGVVHIKLKPLSTKEYESEFTPITYSDIHPELQRFISRQEINGFNDSLPSKNEIDNYLTIYRQYYRIKNNGIATTFYINNTGRAKATDISVTISFPDQLRVYDIETLDQLHDLKLQTPKTDLLTKANYKRLRERARALDLEMPTIKKTIEHDYSSLISLSSPIKNTIFESIEIKDNHVDIESKQGVVHTKSTWFAGAYIVPLCSGEFEAKVTLMCAEYEEQKETTIKFVVDEI